MTSQPTAAILAAARGQRYHIDYGGTLLFQHAADVAAMFVRAARADFRGADVYNLGGEVAAIADFVSDIERVTGFAGITHGLEPLALPTDFDDSEAQATLGQPSSMSVAEGVAATVEWFRRAEAEGRPLPPDPA